MENTKIVETPVDKHKVELKCWLTGGDTRALRSIYTEGLEIGMTGAEPEVKGLTGSVIDKAEDRAIEIVVVSIDENKENIVKRLLEMKSKDFDFVISEINKITTEKKTE